MKKTIFFLPLLVIVLNLSGCNKPPVKEPVPFYDGIYFQYKNDDLRYIEKIVEIKFSKKEDGVWKYEKRDMKIKTKKGEWQNIDAGKVTILIDNYGSIIEPLDLAQNGFDIKNWLPPSERKINAVVSEQITPKEFGLKRIVKEKMHWFKWDVWVVEIIDRGQAARWYYEVTSGWLVGREIKYGEVFGDVGLRMLEDSNAGIPEAE